MLRLKLVSVNKDSVKYSYSPEFSDQVGFFELGLVNGEVFDTDKGDTIDERNIYLGHAINHVRNLILNGKNLPEKRTVAWY